MPELIIEAHGYRASQAKRNGHADDAYIQRHFPVAYEVAQIDFQSYDEEKEHQTQVSDQIQLRHGGIGEDVGFESGNTTHGSRPQQDASYDLGDNARLADLVQGPFQRATEANDDDNLRFSISTVGRLRTQS